MSKSILSNDPYRIRLSLRVPAYVNGESAIEFSYQANGVFECKRLLRKALRDIEDVEQQCHESELAKRDVEAKQSEDEADRILREQQAVGVKPGTREERR